MFHLSIIYFIQLRCFNIISRALRRMCFLTSRHLHFNYIDVILSFLSVTARELNLVFQRRVKARVEGESPIKTG